MSEHSRTKPRGGIPRLLHWPASRRHYCLRFTTRSCCSPALPGSWPSVFSSLSTGLCCWGQSKQVRRICSQIISVKQSANLFFPHPSLRQAWYSFELQHQSRGDNGFLDIAAVGRVVQPIGNVLPCIPLAEFGRQMTQQLANLGKGNDRRDFQGPRQFGRSIWAGHRNAPHATNTALHDRTKPHTEKRAAASWCRSLL
jgi:hypothetical protein